MFEHLRLMLTVGSPLYLSLGLFVCLAARQPATAQAAKPPAATAEPSPFAPGDLSKPVFDTTKPVFESNPRLDQTAGAIAAEVEGRSITLGDVGDAIRALPSNMAMLPFEVLYPGMLGQLVRQQALVIRAQNQGLDDDPAVRRKVKAAADRVLFDEYLRREGSREITEAALLERYKRDVEGRPGPEEVRARIIMVATEKEARDLIAELSGGADFATVARRASRDTTGSEGGDLGFNTRERLNAEIGTVVFALPEGQLAPYPVRSIGSWFVVKVEGRRRQTTPSFASVHEEIRQALLQEAAARLLETAAEGFKVRQFDLLGNEMGGSSPSAH